MALWFVLFLIVSVIMAGTHCLCQMFARRQIRKQAIF